ncbi:MAG: metallophosphoesterase family protein [Solirubrobacteraceae bacterium]
MAPLAIIYDVHGNLPALEAVLADARTADAERFLLGGDYALFGPFQAECVAALRALPQATWIRGNVDRWAANRDVPQDDELLLRAVADCREALGAGLADELGTLPEQVVIDGTRYCHASPVSDMRSFLPEPGGDDDEMLAGASERRVVFGHTHLQFRRSGPGGVELLNPGSVGLPLDGDARAAYALAHGDGSIEHRRVDYDRDAAIAQLEERFGDLAWAQRSIRRLQTSRP